MRGLALAMALAATSAVAGPERIVVAGGDLTEIVHALGEGGHIVGVDTTSTYPPEVSEIAQVGYVRRLSAEGVLSLTPDLVLVAHDAGPEAALGRVASAGVAVARAPEAKTPEAIVDKVRFVGDRIGRGAEAEALAGRIEAGLADVAARVARLEGRPRVLFILSLARGTPLAGGSVTSADTMIARAGGVNAAAGFEGYKPMSREAIIAAAPDVILMMRQHAEREGGIEAALDRPEIVLTPAGRARRGVTMDGMLLLGFGPRTPEAIAELARLLHPEEAAGAGL